MPKKAFKVCGLPRCNKLTLNYVCTDHEAEYEKRKEEIKRQKDKAYGKLRESSSKRGYDSKWSKARQGYINNHPFCVSCSSKGLVVKANVVDHVIPHKGDKGLFWDRDNWQSLCYSCHNRKTATEDGGFGHKISKGANRDNNREN